MQRRMSGTKRRFNEQYPNNINKRTFYGRENKPQQVQSHQSQIIQTSVTADMLESNTGHDNQVCFSNLLKVGVDIYY